MSASSKGVSVTLKSDAYATNAMFPRDHYDDDDDVSYIVTRKTEAIYERF